MRRTFLLLVCALALFSVKQTCGQIVRGRVVDQERQPVVGVAVVMLDTDSTYLAAAASDADGRFAIASEVRPYRLLFQHLAYEMQTLTSEHDEAGEVVLHEYTNALDAVVVEGEKPIVRVEEGRLAYDLEAVSKGKAVNNAYEALTQLPGVSEQDGGLMLAGAGGVTVILNGKPSTMSAEQLASLLRSTPVERIEKAEVMYSTPPQYHVRGAAINLVLRRSHDYSFSGEVHANYTNRFYSNWDAGGNFAFSSPEWSADVTYSAGQAKTKRIIDLYSRHTLADGEHEIAQRQNITSKGEGCRRIRPAGQRTPEHCLYGRIHPAYERPRTCRRQPGQLGQLARGRQHDAQRCAALHVGLRARPLGGLHALQLVAAGRHAEQVRRRQPDSVRRGFGAVRRPGKCQRRPVARPGQWLGA